MKVAVKVTAADTSAWKRGDIGMVNERAEDGTAKLSFAAATGSGCD